jgi:hypothetical protein
LAWEPNPPTKDRLFDNLPIREIVVLSVDQSPMARAINDKISETSCTSTRYGVFVVDIYHFYFWINIRLFATTMGSGAATGETKMCAGMA